MRPIWDWFRRRRGAADRMQVTVLTRAGCHLCDDAHRQLTEQQRIYGFSLVVSDVDADPALAKRYGDRVPVVVINGKERFHGRVNKALLKRLLTHEPNS
jgi:glutaredoxin